MPRLTEDHFSFKCPMNWNDMAVSPNGRFCAHCKKEVFDLTNCSVDEVTALQRKHGSICGSIRVAKAAAVAVSLSAAACATRTTGKPPILPPGQVTDHAAADQIAGGIKPISPREEPTLGKIAPMDPSNSNGGG
jgi:hypothetical protein